MIRRKQLYLHQPENEIFGDCHRTAIACLLDKEPWEVPHFGHRWATIPDYEWKRDVRKYLRTQGYDEVTICFIDLEQAFGFMDMWNDGAFYLIGGLSPRGRPHTVIGQGGGFYWDPHPEGGFLQAPLEHGVYEFTFLVPSKFRDPTDL